MKHKVKTSFALVFASVLAFSSNYLWAQDFTPTDYDKALWMTTRFYGAQRSGENNWTIHDHLPSGVAEQYRGTSHIEDSDGSYDLSGGWNDCGDHVKFGQTQYYSGYMLLKAYTEFKEGFDDYYSADYNGYNSTGQYDWEDGKGQPNGIPDVLDEVKHATDYFIKCARNSTTFYYQVGNGGSGGTGGDHTHRITSVLSQTLANNEGGQDRPIGKNPDDAAMASFCSASLALMSRMYRPFDETYADLCLVHAKYAYDYAKAHKGQSAGTAFNGFYGGNDNPDNAYAIMLAEMYWATNTNSYKTEALAMSAGVGNFDVSPNEFYTYDYSNNGELALYVLHQLGYSGLLSVFNSHMESRWINNSNYNGEGIYSNGGNWGKLRYVGNAGFLVALYSKLNGNTLNAKVYDNVDYIMGSNNNDLSFIAGFETTGVTSVRKPHHRNVYRNDEYLASADNSLSITDNSSRNFQLGSLVGGSLSSGSYSDVWNEYVNTEVCIDYNAGLVGALGAIKSIEAPIDTNKFLGTCKEPDLGSDASLCGVGSITLNTNLTNDGVTTYQWYLNEVPQGSASTTNLTRTVTQGGTWKVVTDSAGECSKTSIVEISDVLPSIDLSADIELCSPSFVTLDAGVTGSGVNYSWEKDNIEVSTSQTLLVTEAGSYEVTASATGCTSESDQIVVTSLLPTAVHDTICASGTVSPSVIGTGNYEWYDAVTDGNNIGSGNSISESITSNTAFYVADNSSFTGSVGRTTQIAGGGTNWGFNTDNRMVFTPSQDFSITSIKVKFNSTHSAASGQVLKLKLYNSSGGEIKTVSSDPTDVPAISSSTGGLIEFTFSDFTIESSYGSDLQLGFDNTTTNFGNPGWDGSGASYPYESDPSGVLTITGKVGSGGTDAYHYFYDWKISAGTSCDRSIVYGIIDATNPSCSGTAPTAEFNASSVAECSETAITFTDLSSDSPTSWSWDFGAGATPSTASGQGPHDVVYSTAGTKSVSLTVSNNIGSDIETKNTYLTIGEEPSAAGAITGTTNVCANESGVTYSISAVAGATGYDWTVPTGATFTGSGTSITVDFGTTGGDVTVTPTNSCGNGTSSNTTVSITNGASPAGAITGATNVCANESGVTYSISAVTGATGYDWTVPAGATFTGSGTSITVDFGTTGGDVTVTPTSTCGDGALSSTTVSITNGASAAGAITGSTTVCEGTTETYSIATVSGASGYTWTLPTGWTIASGTNTNSIVVTVGSGSGTISVEPTSSCGDGTSSNMTVSTSSTPSSAGTISGTTTVCANESGITYSISAVAGATGYDWTVPTGATFTGSGTSITVDFGTTGGDVTVIPTSTCGDGTSSSTTVSITNGASAAGAITGTTTVCANETGIVYSISPVAGATGYDWTVPTGATFTGSGTSITVDFGTTAGDVTVTPTSTCGDGTSSNTTVSITNGASAAGTITGSTTVCEGTTETYSVATVSGASGYDWILPTGWTITSGTNTNSIEVTVGSGSGMISVEPTSSCGDGTSNNITVSTSPAPSTAGTITGTTNVCENESGITYSISAVAGATGYDWTVPTGATFTGSGTSITVDFGTTGGDVTVTPTSTCGDGTSSSTTISITNGASAAGAITGTTTVCANETGIVYSISPVTGATGYDWMVPTGATFTGSGTSITVDFGTTGGDVTVTPTSTCGDGTSSNTTVSITNGASAAGAITGSTTVCEGTTETYSISTVSGASGYDWILPTGWTITSGTNTNSIEVTVGSGSGMISVEPTSSCGDGASNNITVSTSPAPSSAGAITGTMNVCVNESGVTYSISAVAGATGYDWTVPTGATFTGSGTSITVDFGTTGGDVTVIPTSTCGDGTSNNITVSTSPAPSTAGAITGATNVCENESGITYSISAVAGATGYDWTVPTGATFTGSGTSITVDFGTTAGNVTVTPTSTCGDGTSSNTTISITNGASAAGAITGATTVCEGTTETYSIATVSGASGYDWILPTGWTITSGTNTNSIEVTVGSGSGMISVEPTSSCGDGASNNITVSTSPAPSSAGAITGTTNVCENESGVTYSISAVAGATGYDWTVPTGATFTGSGTSITVDFGTTGGDVTVTPTSTCGDGTSSSTTVSITNGASAAGAITGFASVCEGTTETYSIATVLGASGYNWILPTGWTITTGTNTNSIEVVVGSGSGMISVEPTSSCGNGTLSDFSVSVSDCGATADFSVNDATICEGGSVTFTNASSGDLNGVTYLWDFGSGASPATASTAGPHSVVYNTSGNKTVTLTLSGTSTDSEIKTNMITVGEIPEQPTILGSASIGCDDTESFSVENLNSSLYNWNVSSGSTISGNGSSQVDIDFSGVSGMKIVSVTEINGGCVSQPASLLVSVCNPTAIEGEINEQISLRPNPFVGSTQLFLSDAFSNVELYIVDMNGRVLETHTSDFHNGIEIGSSLPAGSYFMRVINGNKTYNLKFIKLSN